MKCDQIPSTDNILPDHDHSGIYNTQNSQQTYALKSIFESCGAKMLDNDEIQQREE